MQAAADHLFTDRLSIQWQVHARACRTVHGGALLVCVWNHHGSV